jgi:hypothetical protein
MNMFNTDGLRLRSSNDELLRMKMCFLQKIKTARAEITRTATNATIAVSPRAAWLKNCS